MLSTSTGRNRNKPQHITLLSVVILSVLLVLISVCFFWQTIPPLWCDPVGTLKENDSVPCDPHVIYRGPAGLPPLANREEIGAFLEARNLTHGAEVGVQKGQNARLILDQWPSCLSFLLVDLWSQQENYKDVANLDQQGHDQFFEETKRVLEPFAAKTKFFRMFSTEAAKQIPDQSLDFVYVDARHDYCGVMEDLKDYYQKVRPGGIMAGHDFLDAAQVKKLSPEQDWSVCMDGSIQLGAVKGAVEEFALTKGLVVSVMYNDGNWPSWMIQKPTRPECVKEEGRFGTNDYTAT